MSRPTNSKTASSKSAIYRGCDTKTQTQKLQTSSEKKETEMKGHPIRIAILHALQLQEAVGASERILTEQKRLLASGEKVFKCAQCHLLHARPSDMMECYECKIPCAAAYPCMPHTGRKCQLCPRICCPYHCQRCNNCNAIVCTSKCSMTCVECSETICTTCMDLCLECNQLMCCSQHVDCFINE